MNTHSSVISNKEEKKERSDSVVPVIHHPMKLDLEFFNSKLKWSVRVYLRGTLEPGMKGTWDKGENIFILKFDLPEAVRRKRLYKTLEVI